MSQSPTYYNAEAVRRVLNWPMVNEAVEAALKAVVADTEDSGGNNTTNTDATATGTELAQGGSSSGTPYVSQPARNFTQVGEDSGKLLLTMPAFVGNYRLTAGGAGGDAAEVSTLACKVVTSFRGNNQRQPPLPNINANILLFNEETGELNAIMAGTDITTWRTVSASLVATKHLYFRRFGPRAEQQRQISVAIIGCGVQGRMHAFGMCANFRVQLLTLYNRTTSRAIDLRNDLQETFDRDSSSCVKKPDYILVCNTTRDALALADVVCVATYSRSPLVTARELTDKRPVHINGKLETRLFRYSLQIDRVEGYCSSKGSSPQK